MTSRQLLEVLRDARELGDKAFEAAVLEQFDLDAEYVKATAPRWNPYRPRYEPEEESLELFRGRVAYQAHAIQEANWTVWRQWPTGISSLAEIYRRRYSAGAIVEISNRQHPTFSLLKKGDGWGT